MRGWIQSPCFPGMKLWNEPMTPKIAEKNIGKKHFGLRTSQNYIPVRTCSITVPPEYHNKYPPCSIMLPPYHNIPIT